jgi:hypothetical protein
MKSEGLLKLNVEAGRMKSRMWVAFLAAALAAEAVSAQIPALPDGTDTRWTVERPDELVAYVLFDPATVKDRLPPTLRFITVGELADQGLQWAKGHLADDPSHRGWGISFLEIVRMGVCDIDGRAPAWPENGAAALWLARVAPSDSAADLGPGVPLLALELWIPDSLFVAYMRGKGYYSTYGDARLRGDPGGDWRGSLVVDGLKVVAECTPTGPVDGGDRSRGMQVFFPPLSSSMTTVVRVAFAGHRIQECAGKSSWKFEGTHALAGVVVLGPSTYQFGYRLVGGVYRR